MRQRKSYLPYEKIFERNVFCVYLLWKHDIILIEKVEHTKPIRNCNVSFLHQKRLEKFYVSKVDNIIPTGI